MNRSGRSALPPGSCKNRSYGAHPRSTVCPCCDLADDLQPQILCIVWLAGDIILPKLPSRSIGHRTTKLGLEQLGGSAPMWREINEETRGGFSRDHLYQQQRHGPLRPSPEIRDSLSKNSFPGRTMFCDMYPTKSPGPPVSADPRGPGKSCPWRCLRFGTTDALHKVHLHRVAFGWRPDRGRHQGSSMVGLNASILLHPRG